MSLAEREMIMRIFEAELAIQPGKSYEAGTEMGAAVGVGLGGGVSIAGIGPVFLGTAVLVRSGFGVRIEVGDDSLVTVGEVLRRRVGAVVD